MSQTALSGRRLAHLAIVISLAALGAVGGDLGGTLTPLAQQPGPCDPPNSNPIVCENAKPGNPSSEWDVNGAGDDTIQGFATDISVDQGQVIGFKIDTNANAYRLDIYRMGYYDGMGARLVTTVMPSASLPQNQPACLSDPSTGLVDCGNWAQSASWTVPATAVSGIYFAKLTRFDTGGSSHIMFIVRDDDGRSDLLFQTSDTTWQAYNRYGGNSLYVGDPAGRAYKVSYNRPLTVRGDVVEDSPFNAEYPMVRWLEANGYHVSYSTGVDTDRRGTELLEHKVFLSVGHDEYWSGTQRTRVEQARAAGVHLAFFSGNEVFWKTRWENSISASGTPYRTLVTYKETHANAKIDPATNVWTGTWRDPRFSPPADGGRPENALTGTIFYVNSGTSGIRVPAAQGKLRFWRNTSVAGLADGTFADMPFGTLGYEWDEDRDNGSRPPGLIRLSDTTVSGVDYLQDHGSTYASGTANHALTLYKHSSGALVFGAGTVQWSWGLDSNHDRGSTAPSLAMQQATVNLFVDMQALPLTPQANIVITNPPTDTLAPLSAVTVPAAGATVPVNATVTISGTATDLGGGVVAGVEVSVDNGATWRRATGTTAWTYQWFTGSAGARTIRSRAVDDTANLGVASAPVSVTVSGTQACPCSIWAPTQGPAGSDDGDPNAVEVGTRFRSDVNGYVSAIRFYKSSRNTGTHVGNLWTANGTLLASAVFSGESTSGWQEVPLPTPVAITANTTYVVSYHTSTGFYYGEDGYFSGQGVDNGPLHGLADGANGPNGLYKYGSTGFPTETYNSENYWVDVVVVTTVGPDTTAPTVTVVSPANSSSGVATTTPVTATFSENVSAATVTGSTFELRNSANALVTASVTSSASTRTATLTPGTALLNSATYTARVRGGSSGVKDAAGNALAADVVWSFTTAAPPPPPPTEGPGGPILVVSSSSNPFSRYYAEILRAEGLNAFTAMDASLVTATTLNSYDVVILGQMSLTAAQVTMFSNWVNAGGNLIAMRPDKQLAVLLGLTDAATTLSEGYLLVNTAAAPGAGIVNQTMQFHGIADRYTLNGAAAVATLYSNATTATANPAVTMRNVGTSGGQVAAFTYDLARSIVLTRQGNPSWSGIERDGIDPLRSSDLFFGGSQPDWVDLNKVAIPQADEQQRLLANMVGFMNADRKPLPKFWYFPRGEKAVVVMTGDDHANNGTAGRFDIYKGNSPSGCNVTNWECVRATSYIFPNTPLSNSQVAAYRADGFEIGVHLRMSGANEAQMQCNNYTPSSIGTDYSSQLAQFAATFPGAGPVRTNRTHCIVWSDYDTQPQVALANAIRLDTNYYYWPGSWVQDRPGFMTGSGMPMRFAKTDGTIIDVYQAATQMTDESDQSWPFTVDALLDRALGAEGYYGFFTANMHTDTVAHDGSEAIVASALARSVPVISAAQLLTWVDGRNGSSFGNLSWNGTALSFTISVGSGANGLEAMLPASSGTGTLTSLTRAGTPVSYRIETIKGVAYVIFAASAGNHVATYTVDTTAPMISGVAAVPGSSSAVVTWSTNEAATSRVDFGLAPGSLGSSASVPGLSAAHSVTLPGLSSATTYYYRVTSADSVGNSATAPPTAASFTTTTAPSLNCPCTIWPATQVPAVPSEDDGSAVELGVKFRPSLSGFITGIRFYKGAQNAGTHTGNLWTATGVPLASVVFTGESASGWQEATFSQPVAVTANTVYVASYHTTSGFYAANGGYFSGSVVNGPLEALSNGQAAGNGVYRYGTSGFPTQTFNSTNYWVDVVFVTAIVPDTTAPQVTSTAPAAAAAAVPVTTTVSAAFNEQLAAASVTTSTVELRDSGTNLVAATVNYTAATRTASLQPSAPLAYSSTYTARVRSGSTGVKDVAGNGMTADVTWTFTTAAPPPPPPDEGPGGPILIVASTANPFTKYYAEILRAEGFNSFTLSDISAVSTSTLTQYDVVVLGEMTLSAAQVSMFGTWVNGGGNLIAMRPDKQLASLLGLTDAASTLANAYLQINTASAPGAGLVGETMQFHGTADRYTLSGATAVSTLFSNAGTSTPNPAVTLRNVGTLGGQAVAFTFDLARSVVYTRQGNPAWSGLDRDGFAPIRSDDLFFGGSEPNWVDLTKVAIPQADEQQRLLANVINLVTRDRKPLPRFWYLPRGLKAAVVMTGDDHGNNGTAGRFDLEMASSPSSCSVDDWQCVRSTSYVFPNTPLPAAQATTYTAAGFEVGVHINTGCADFNAASLQTTYASDLTAFGSSFPGVPAPRTNRTHCIVWSDYTSQAEVALANGIRLDTNYYYWPGGWVNNVPGVFTGSGFPMRFAKTDGTMIDVYQAATQMTDESDQMYPFTANTLLDRALGPEGYFGTFVTNMHTDTAAHASAAAIVASAQARGVPVISAQQLLTWLDGRNGSKFSSLVWDGNRLTFGVTAAAGARGLQALLPSSVTAGAFTGLSRNGAPAAWTVTTIKGITYVAFDATTGSYVAEYGVDTIPPTISQVAAAATTTSATVTWTTNETATSRVDYGTAPAALNSTTDAPGAPTSHSVTLSGLASGTTYYYRAVSLDAGGNPAMSAVQSFTTASLTTVTVSDGPDADFLAGTADAGVHITRRVDGELTLAGATATGFDGPGLPTGWSSGAWNAGGAATVSGGRIVVDGAWASIDALSGVGTSLEFVATFSSDAFEHAGFGITLNETVWAMFSTGPGGSLYARTHDGATATDTPLPGNWLNAAHRYRIDRGAAAVSFFIDGVSVATHPVALNIAMRPILSNFATGGAALIVDSLQLSPPYVLNGIFTSRVVDAGAPVNWNTATWAATVPAGSALTMSARFGNTPAPDPTWSGFATLAAPGAALAQTSRYAQYRATLSSDTGAISPEVASVSLSSAGGGTPSISASDILIVEGNTGTTAGTFTLTLSSPSTQEVRVNYTTASGSATSGSDFTPVAGTAVFPAGAVFATVPVSVVGDTVLEADEMFFINLSAPINATIGDAQGVGTIANDELPSLSIANVGAAEGNAGSAVATFTVTLAPAGTRPISVAFATSNGTATAGTDYTAASGTLSFPVGVTQRTVTVLVSGDTLNEADETFTVTLSNPANATLGQATATGTIQNDDPLPQITIADVSVTEGNSGTTTAVFNMALSAPSGRAVTASYATANGTAVSPGDYAVASGQVTFAAGATTATVSVSVIGDSLDEADETFVVNLTNPVNATIGDSQATGTVVDNDPAPTLAIANVTVTEGTGSAVNAVFAVTLSTASGRAVTVAYATANGTATAPADFASASGTLTFAAGVTTQNVTVAVAGDAHTESSETFVVNLSNPTNATIADSQGTGTITDNDVPPSLSINNVTIAEGNSGTVNAVFTVSLSAAASQNVTVNYATSNGTATAGTTGDYTATSGSLTFTPGQTTRQVTVVVRGDVLDEADDETFNVNLSGAANATISDAQGVGTIQDNDPQPTISINNVSISEGDFLTRTATFTVTLSAASGRTITMAYATANGTASSTNDYVAENGTVTFNAGTTSQTITISVRGDNTDESNETFFVNLTNAVNATFADAQGQGTIVNDD